MISTELIPKIMDDQMLQNKMNSAAPDGAPPRRLNQLTKKINSSLNVTT